MKSHIKSSSKFPVIDFSLKHFTPVRADNVTIGKLEELAVAHGDSPFVLYDAANRETACVIPEAIQWAVKKFDLDSNEIAAETGIFKVLRRNQAVVNRDQPASRIARLTSSQDVNAVIAVAADGTPEGVFLPGVVSERLHETHFVKNSLPPVLQTKIQSFAGNIVKGIDVIELHDVSFHSEKINVYGGEPYVCEGNQDDGPHVRNSCPCQYHPGAQCRRRKLF